MAFFKTKGIIIKEVDTGEADKVITIFSEREGKITAYAKGARRPKNSLSACSQFLCYSDLLLYSGKEMYNLSSCQLIESFYKLREDMVILTYAAYFAEIINDVVQKNEPAVDILKLFLNSLYMLTKGTHDPKLIVRIFEMRLMVFLGYSPSVNGCILCNSTDVSNISFSFQNCSFICNSCASLHEPKQKLSPEAARAIQYIVCSRANSLFNFTVTKSVLNELEIIFRRYLFERLEKKYTKLDFLRTLTI